MGVDGREEEHQTPIPALDSVETTSSQLRAILNALPALIGYWDTNLRNVMANDAYVEFFGFTPAQMHGVHIRDVLGDELYALNAPFMQRALAGEAQLFDRAIPDPQGRIRHTQASYLPDVVDGEVRGFFVMVTDITARRQAEIALEESAELNRFLAENSSELLLRVADTGQILYASNASGGLPELSAADLVGVSLVAVVHPDDRVLMQTGLDTARGTGAPSEVDLRIATSANNEYVWVNVATQSVIGPDADTEFHVSIKDIRERREAERALADAEATQRLILENLNEGVVFHSLRSGVIRANRAATEMFGIVPGAATVLEQISRHIDTFEADGSPLDLSDTPSLRAARSRRAERGRILQYRYPDGTTRWMQVDAIIVSAPERADTDGSGDTGGTADTDGTGGDGDDDVTILQTFIDITATKQAELALAQSEEQLRRLATTDALTGLPNRRYLIDHLATAIDRNRRTPQRLAVLFLDLDGFKAINDNFGHEAGDELLAAVGRRVTSKLRPGDTFARYGGDEFVIVVENLDHPDDAHHLADRIEHALAQPFQLAAGTARIGGSVGVAGTNDADTADAVLAHADRVMYQRKHHRKTHKGTANAGTT